MGYKKMSEKKKRTDSGKKAQSLTNPNRRPEKILFTLIKFINHLKRLFAATYTVHPRDSPFNAVPSVLKLPKRTEIV
jgi:hypothetical protein